MKNNKDKKEVLAAVKQDGYTLEYADKSLREDKEVVLAAIKQNSFAFKYADKSLKKDKAFLLIAVKEDGLVLEFADKTLTKDKELVLLAIKQNSFTLDYADKSLKKDREVVLAAVNKDGLALEYADKSLKKDREVVLAAVNKDGLALEYADATLLKNKMFVMKAAKLNSEALDYINKLSLEEEASQIIEEETSQVIDFTGKKITKVSIYLYKIWEKETMPGTFFFEDGTSKEGYSYNNNMLSGTIDFSNEEYSIPIKDFIQSFKNNEWTQFISDSIDNFDGTGKSIDYDFDDFENFEEGNSEECEWEANKDPNEIILYFGKMKFALQYENSNCYLNNKTKYTKEEILDIIKKSV